MTAEVLLDQMDLMVVLHEACLTCLLWIILVGITEMMVHQIKIQIEVSIRREVARQIETSFRSFLRKILRDWMC